MNYVHKLQEKMKEQGMDEEYIKLLKRILKEGEEVEILLPDGSLEELRLSDMQDEAGEAITCAPHAQRDLNLL